MELSRLKSMSRSGMLGATLSVFWLSLGFASCSPLEEGRGCIDVSSAGWREMLDGQFGRQVCFSGAFYPGGADGVFFEVDPPWVWVEFAGSVIFEVGMP